MDMTTTDPKSLSDEEITETIILVSENLDEVPRQSSYATRARPFLKACKAEATRRGLEVEV